MFNKKSMPKVDAPDAIHLLAENLPGIKDAIMTLARAFEMRHPCKIDPLPAAIERMIYPTQPGALTKEVLDDLVCSAFEGMENINKDKITNDIVNRFFQLGARVSKADFDYVRERL